MKFRILLFAFLLVAGLATPALASGPIGTYYLTAGDTGMNWAVQGPNVVLQHPQNCAPFCGLGGEYAIALDASVRTLGNSPFIPGSEYTYGLVATGVKYAYPVNAHFYDGTQDGTHNYSVGMGTGRVFSFDTNWTNPQLLFSLNVFGYLGITYDRFNNSLWLSKFSGGNRVADYTLGGVLISSFNTPFSSISSLAMDVNGTLWMGSQGTLGTFYNYSTAGAFLGSVFYPALANQNTLGGEIAATATPEPGTLGLLATGIAGGFGLLRRLRRS